MRYGQEEGEPRSQSRTIVKAIIAICIVFVIVAVLHPSSPLPKVYGGRGSAQDRAVSGENISLVDFLADQAPVRLLTNLSIT